ncbi:MAG: hypothetical protein BWK76_15215 [Desulfobulbaceae bacterium A2]|nr:MAG: hypothetical protein BWK76_15215 [Desulfobulbaceae bacterium A2]
MIRRNPQEASSRTYDLIIVGGGIYGIALSYVAARNGLTPLLLEQGDFAHATSLQHLRIVHGGFRYLQSMDLPRFFESVGERRWFLTHFGGLVQPLACMMPLYNRGIHRVPILRLALGLNDILSRHRNDGVAPAGHLANGRTVSPDEALAIFPGLIGRDLHGAAIWHDASVDDPQRLYIEWLRHACRLGATALNYCKVTELLPGAGRTEGVLAQDLADGGTYRFQAPLVINAAGPWCRELAARFDRDREELFRPSLACNVLFQRPALSSHALALTPERPGARTCFLRPWKGRLLAGTIHESWHQPADTPPRPSAAVLQSFLDDLNLAVPGLSLGENDILHIQAGLLPAREHGSARISVREIILDHGAQGGPAGLWSVSGVKFTTARLVAEKTLGRIFPEQRKRLRQTRHDDGLAAAVDASRGRLPAQSAEQTASALWQAALQELVAEESVIHLDDLALRRTSLGDDPPALMTLAPRICELFPWDAGRTQEELTRLRHSLDVTWSRDEKRQPMEAA